MREGTPEEAGFDADRIELIRQRGAQWAEQSNTQGLVLLVARHGVICLEEAWGALTDKPDAPPMTTDAIFMLASMGKPVTATLAMMLVEEGRLGLTRPLNQYIPELLGEGSEEVLVQHLLTHTAGYGDEASITHVFEHILGGNSGGGDAPPCPEGQHPLIHNTLEALYTVPITRPPGTVMAYGNNHYVLLGEVLRRITGMPIEDLAWKRIFDPLGMEHTAFGYAEWMQPRFAHQDLAPLIGETPLPVETIKDYIWFSPNAGGGLFGTARDYARFAQMWLNRGRLDGQRIIGEATVAQMLRNQIPGLPVEGLGGSTGNWGYGTMIYDDQRFRWYHGTLPPVGSVSHGGYGGCAFWIDREHDLVGIYFSVCPEMDSARSEIHSDFDLFQNLVSAAVVD